jgi:polycystin 1L2
MSKRPLGEIEFLHIGHDNSGKGWMKDSWFLKTVVVHDLQTREKYYFIYENWLAIDEENGLEVVLQAATGEQKLDLPYLTERLTKEKLTDEHLWFSTILRPTQSSFNSTDRITCCMVLICFLMLTNILYFEKIEEAKDSNEIVYGPIRVSLATVSFFL